MFFLQCLGTNGPQSARFTYPDQRRPLIEHAQKPCQVLAFATPGQHMVLPSLPPGTKTDQGPIVSQLPSELL